MINPTATPKAGQYPPINASTAISDVLRLYADRIGKKDRSQRISHEVMERLRSANRDTIYERQVVWPRNLLMTYGEQRIRWNTYGRRWVRRPPGTREKQFQTNLLLGRVSHMAAELTQARPFFQVIPSTPDLSDRRSAKLGERVLYHDYRELDIGQIRHLAVLDSLIFGYGITEVGWDPYAGELKVEYEAIRDEDGNPVKNEMGVDQILRDKNGQPVVREARYEGAPYCRNVSPFEFFTPPGVTAPDLSLCPWVIRVMWKGEAEIRKKYDLPENFDFGSPDPEFEHIESVSGFLSRGQHGTSPSEKKDTGLHLVVEYFEPACDVEGFEHGKVYTVVNDKLVGEERLSGDTGKYPFQIYPWQPKRGQFIPHAWVTDQIEIQMRYNMATSQELTWLSLFSQPNILVPKGSGIPQNIAFNFRRYDFNPAAGPPQFWTPPPPSVAITNAAERAVKDMDQVGSQFAFGRGEPVQGVPSARYAQYMQDADAKEIGPIVRMHATAMERMGEYLLGVHRRFDTAERLITITGRANRIELIPFQGTMLRQGLRVNVFETSMLSVIPSARMEQMRELLAAGLIGQQPMSPKTQRKVLEYIRMPELLDIETGDSKTDRWIEDTLARVIEKGEPIQVSPFWEEPLLQTLKEAVIERTLEDDAWDWDDQTKQRLFEFYQTLGQRLAEIAQQKMQEEEQMARKQMAMQLEVEQAKSQMKKSEDMSKEIGKAGAELMKAINTPQPDKVRALQEA